jgi:hypothetical protein
MILLLEAIFCIFFVLLAFGFSQLIQYVVLLWFFLNLSFFGTMVNFEVELVKLQVLL